MKSQSEVFFPKTLPIKIYPPAGLCDPNSKQKFYMKGEWFTGKVTDNPLITFKVNSTTILFQFEFRPGDGKGNFSKYGVWSVLNGLNVTNGSEVVLRDLDPKLGSVEYNLTVTCANFAATGTFKVIVNYWDPKGDPNGIVRNSSNWDIVAPKAMSVSFLSTTKMSCTRSALQWMSTFHGVLQKSIPPQMQFLPGVSVCRIVTMKCQLFPAWPHLLFHNLASEIVQAT